MDANQLVIALNNILDLADTLDSSGIGISAMTNGSHTTREICKTELGQFLLYVGDGAPSFTDGQAALINIVLGDVYGQSPAWRLKLAASQLDAPKAGDNLTYLAFQTADAAIAQRNGAPSTQTRDLLISLYESFGTLLVMLNQNAVSQARYTEYVSALKNRMNDSDSSGSAAPEPPTKPVSQPAPKEKPSLTQDVSELIPAGVSLTDSQKEYLIAIVDLINRYGPVDVSTVAAHMHKSTSAVRSAVSTLIKKGILDKNADAKIVIAGNQKAISEKSNGQKTSTMASSSPIPVLSGNTIRFGKTVTFELKDGCKCTPSNAPNGKPYFDIEYGSFSGAVGYMDAMELKEYVIKPGETGIEAVHRLGWDKGGWIRWSDSPEAEVHMRTQKTVFQKLFSICLYIQTEDNPTVVQVNVNSGWYDDDMSWNQQAYDLLIEIISMARVNGEPLPDHGLTGERLMKLLKPDFDEKNIGQILLPGKEKRIPKKTNGLKEQCESLKCLLVGTTLSMCRDKDIREIIIPDGVTQIGKNAFEGCQKLKKVILPDSLKAIQSHAFKNCTSLETINIPDGVNTLGGWAFQNCNLRSVKLPAGITVIKVCLFAGCKSLERIEIQNGVTEIENDAFAGCRLLTEVKMPATIETIGLRSFTRCKGLVTVYLPKKQIKAFDNSMPDKVLVVIGSAKSKDTFGDIKKQFTEGKTTEISILNSKGITLIGYDNGMPNVPFLPEVYHEHYTIVTSGTYTSHRDADYRAQNIQALMRNQGQYPQRVYDMMAVKGDTYVLDSEARKLAKVFRMDADQFDPYADTEALIREGMFKDVRMLHALRSLAWMTEKITEADGSDLADISFDRLEEIGEYIEENNSLVYEPDSKCEGLCGHYDWHVFFVPDAYLHSKTAQKTNLQTLTGKGNRGGNSAFMVMGGDISAMRRMNAISNMICRNEETLESLEKLRDVLIWLKPVMETIHDGYLMNRDRSEELNGPLADALTAWCALSIAAAAPFYSEEAADSFEANAGLDRPLERPDDELDDQPIRQNTASAARKAAGRTRKTVSKASGEVLDLNGAKVIEANQFSGNMDLRNIIIPEGVTEIGERAFYCCMNLESVVIPGTVKKIGKFAFMSCRNLKKVELEEGTEEIDTHAFGATNNLKEVHLPDSLRKVDRHLFGMGGDSPYATANMSGRLARKLTDAYRKEKTDYLDAISARRFVIDGVGYETLNEYIQKGPPASSDVSKSSSKPAKAEKKRVNHFFCVKLGNFASCVDMEPLAA